LTQLPSVTVTEDHLVVVLADGRELAAPLAWFPRLVQATTDQRRNWRLIGRGHGIHWPDVDEDIWSPACCGRGDPASSWTGGTRMKTFSLTDLKNRSGDVVEAALRGPVDITCRGQRRCVLLSAEAYDPLVSAAH
jgi:prevent-host-death family protein